MTDPTDAARDWMRAAGQYPNLPREDTPAFGAGQWTCGRCIRDYQTALKAGRATPAMKRQAEEARLKLFLHNLRYVVDLAKDYIRPDHHDFDAVVQEGNIALWGITLAYDPDHENKMNPGEPIAFTTYAHRPLLQAVARAAKSVRVVRVPVHVQDALARARREQDRRAADGEEVTLEEAARGVLSEEVIAAALAWRDVASLDQIIPGADGVRLGDIIEDDSYQPEEAATQEALRADILMVLAALPDPERKVVQMRIGLLDGKSRTLDEVGIEKGLTREMVRQQELDGMALLQLPERRRFLEDYLKGEKGR